MQNPTEKKEQILIPFLVGIGILLIGSIPLYFLKFFGFSIQSTIMKSIATPSNTELYTNILLILILCLFGLIAFIVSLLIWRKKGIKTEIDNQRHEKIETNKKETLEDQFKRSILLHILKLRGLKQIASPKNIANQMKQDPGIILAHLRKLHSEQFVTFITGGLPPTLDTDFFLSPKAFEIIKINDTQPVN